MLLRMFSFAALAAALFGSPAQAQLSQAWRVCSGEVQAAPREVIARCTDVIKSRKEARKRIARAHVYRGYMHEQLGDLKRAKADYSEAIRQDPQLGIAYYRRAHIWRDEGNRERLMADLTEAIRHTDRADPNLPEFYFERAMRWEDTGEADRAIADFTEAIRIKPKLTKAYARRGDLLIARGDFDRALSNYTEALGQLPPDPFAGEGYDYFLSSRGYVHFLLGDFKSSAADLRKAIELLPNATSNEDRVPFLYVALTRSGEDGSAELLAQLDRWKEFKSDFPAIFDFLLGRSSAETVLVLACPGPRCQCGDRFFIGQWHLIRGEIEQARSYLQKVAEWPECRDIQPYRPAAVVELKRMRP